MGARVSSGSDSKQNYGTPWDFIEAVERAWGVPYWSYDLAADEHNCKGRNWFDEQQDSLSQNWRQLDGYLWLNPPYNDIAPWVEKCYRSTRTPGRSIFVLIPASVGSNWYLQWVHNKCDVYFLNPRLRFVGASAPYPRDLMLCAYGGQTQQELDNLHPPSVWRWTDQRFTFARDVTL